jgi:hypothetical protein
MTETSVPTGRGQTNRRQAGRQAERSSPYEPMETDGQNMLFTPDSALWLLFAQFQ